MMRPTLLVLAAFVLAACKTPPAEPPPSLPHQSLPQEPAAKVEAAPLPTPAVVPPPGPVTPASQQQAQKAAMAASLLLETGNEEQARAELMRALGLDPHNKLALNLSRQVAADPLATLGTQSFAYTVRPSETLSRIAERFLGDIYAFYILARYNGILVPRQVTSGQVIRVPGKAPPLGATAAASPQVVAAPQTAAQLMPSVEQMLRGGAQVPLPAAAPVLVAKPPTEPTPGERAMRSASAAERAQDLPRARSEYLAAAGLNEPGAAGKAEQMRTQLVARHSASARNALARQDLDNAIGNWQKVLELDPANSTARLELERTRGLKEKLKNLK